MCECKKENPQSLQGAFMRLLHRYTEVNFGRLKDMGVHPGQLPFLNIISHKEGISQRELAECLHVKPPTVAVTVKRLEKADVIYRRPDPNDMRISRIYLTAGFSEEELELARHFFTRMIQNLNVLSGGKEELPLEGVRSPEKDKEAWSCETRKGGRA